MECQGLDIVSLAGYMLFVRLLVSLNYAYFLSLNIMLYLYRYLHVVISFAKQRVLHNTNSQCMYLPW